MRQGRAWLGGLTQDDGDLFKRVLDGNVVEGASGVYSGHTGVQGPGDLVVPVDVDVTDVALQHAHQESAGVERDAAGIDCSGGTRCEA
jgi:hypothetical protein